MVMTKAEIMYAISTGDVSKKEKMQLLKMEVGYIIKGERIRIANKLMAEELEDE